MALLITERPAEAWAHSRIAARKGCRRLAVPVAVEREIPREVAPKLDVIRHVEIGIDARGLVQRRENRGLHGQIGLVEFEEFHTDSS